MLEVLYEVEKNIRDLLVDNELHTMYIDYHKPYVSRIWFQHGEYRVYLHKIESCDTVEVLYHPHPWESAIRIVEGRYEMGIGHSKDDFAPRTDCKLILPAGTCYEMVEPDAWHYVKPLDGPSYSIMVTGKLTGRKMPIEPEKEFRKLTEDEIVDILEKFM